MTYYSSSDYTERYYVDFIDIDGNAWHISIQDPTFSGTATELTGAETPIEWIGAGDESQTDVVLGSTGTLRFLCLDGQESIFAQGALFPDIINDRKVVVTRNFPQGGEDNWYIIWQGFIKPEQYTQEWDRTPYEIELPIVSAIAATEFFPMPDYDDVQDVETIADLIWYVLGLLGCTFTKLLTNKPVYEDFYGNVQYVTYNGQSVPAHWTESYATPLYFYDYEGDGVKPKMIKDVLETLCYPYGKIYEYQTYIAVCMNAGKWISGDDELYELANDNNSRFSASSIPLNELTLSSLQIAGTDNKVSLISRPSKVSFDGKLETDDDIFEMSDEYYNQPINITDSTKLSHRDLNRKYRALYHFNNQIINTNFGANWWFSDNGDFFCRVVDVDGSDRDGYTYSTLIPFGLYIRGGKSMSFDINRGVRTVELLNKIKMSLKVYAYMPNAQMFESSKNPVHGTYETGGTGVDYIAALYVLLLDVTNPNSRKYLDCSPGENHIDQWSWKPYSNTTPLIEASNLQYLNESCVALFNEPRDAGDTKPHTLRLLMAVVNSNNLENAAPMLVQVKFEYERDNTFTTSGLINAFEEVNDSIVINRQVTDTGGSGEAVEVKYKTMCGRNFIKLNGSANVPYNSFCDAQKYIDLQNRKKLEIEAVKFTIPFVMSPFLVNDTDTNEVYVPVAVGMNPRMNTCRLTLVTTNIGINQPT